MTMTSTFKTGEDRLRSSNFVAILDVPRQHDGQYCKDLMDIAGIQVDTPEVILSHQGLIEVCSFERLKCMEALWLNDNLLTKIEGLDTNVQLKALYLHDNRISTLKGSLKYLKHIEMLALQNNRLTDVEATLKGMEHLTRLEELDLSGNPLANELNYRQRVIYRFPRLKVLDRHVIEWAERLAVTELFEGAKMSNLGFLKRKPLWKNAPTRPVACLSELTKEMYGEIEVYKTKTRRANERKEREAVEGNKKDIVDGGRIPLAKTVDEVSLKTKTLTDVLSCIDADYGTSLAHTFSTTHRPKTHKSPDTSGTGGVTGAISLSPRRRPDEHNRAAKAAAEQQMRCKRDFVVMKRYITPSSAPCKWWPGVTCGRGVVKRCVASLSHSLTHSR